MKKLILPVIVLGLLLAGPTLAALPTGRQAPAKVTGVKVTQIKSNAATVSWNKVDDAFKYIVKVRTKAGKLKVTHRTKKKYAKIKSLNKNTIYKVRVKAKDEAGDSGSWSKQKSFQTRSWRYYHSNRYEFNLKFPKAWKGLKIENVVTDYGDYGRDDIGKIRGVRFKLPTTDIEHYPSGYATIFAVGRYTHDQWDLFQEFPIPPGDPIGETDDYIFGWGYQQSYPYEHYPRHEEVDDIIDTFELD